MNAGERRRKILEEAWTGDAVLCLYARGAILRRGGGIDNAQFERMTSNRFLAGIGEPSQVEASIGRIYASDGLDAAFAWIEENLLPLFRKQEEKRINRAGSRPASASAAPGLRARRLRIPD